MGPVGGVGRVWEKILEKGKKNSYISCYISKQVLDIITAF
jgi:hypothetical protein